MKKVSFAAVAIFLIPAAYGAQSASGPLSVSDGASEFKAEALAVHNSDSLKALNNEVISPRNATNMQLGLERGFTSNIQAGAFLKFQATPSADVRNVVVNAQYAFANAAHVRLDGGLRRSKCGASDGVNNYVETYNGVVAGIGFPAKVSLGSAFAFTSGRPGPEGYNDDLFLLDQNDCASMYVVTAPIGAMLTLGHATFAARTGFKTLLGDDALGSIFVPFGFDATYALNSKFDVGATVEIPGGVGAPGFSDKHVDYLFEERFSAWTQVRF